MATNHLKSDEFKTSILIVSGAQSTWKTLGIKPANPTRGPHWQKLRAPITMSLISMPYATKFITFNTNNLCSFAMLLHQQQKKDMKNFLRYSLSSVATLRRSLTGKLFPSPIQMKFH